MFKMEITGLDKALRNIENLKRRAKAVSGENRIPLDELFNPSFMNRYTSHGTIAQFFEATGFKLESQEDLQAIPEDQLDGFVKGNSRFSSWKDMLEKAAQEWFQKKLMP